MMGVQKSGLTLRGWEPRAVWCEKDISNMYGWTSFSIFMRDLKRYFGTLFYFIKVLPQINETLLEEHKNRRDPKKKWCGTEQYGK